MVTWGEELPINVLALVPFTRYLPNKPVLLSWDSISVVSYIIQQGGTKSIDLMKQVGDLFSPVILLVLSFIRSLHSSMNIITRLCYDLVMDGSCSAVSKST